MAAPTYEAQGTYLEQEATTHNFAAPSGVGANSVVLLIAFIGSSDDPTITLPSGFTHLSGSPVYRDDVAPTGESTQSSWVVVAWHRATGSESGPYTLTLGIARFAAGCALRFEGAITSGTPFDTTDVAGNTNSATVSPDVDLTTLGADRLLLHVATNWAGGTWTQSSGFTERVDTGFGTITLGDKVQAAAGATGTVTATCTGNDKMQALLTAMIPVASAAPRYPAATVQVLP